MFLFLFLFFSTLYTMLIFQIKRIISSEKWFNYLIIGNERSIKLTRIVKIRVNSSRAHFVKR